MDRSIGNTCRAIISIRILQRFTYHVKRNPGSVRGISNNEMLLMLNRETSNLEHQTGQVEKSSLSRIYRNDS